MKKLFIILLIIGILSVIILGRQGRLWDTNKPLDTATYTKSEHAYGTHALETLDIYVPQGATDAPVIVMVHGGGWQIGDKENKNIWENKIAYWLPKGYIFVAVNYPMLADNYYPDKQAATVAEALTYIQTEAKSWGGDTNSLVLIGHSAGAHLVSLVDATRANYPNLQPWSGTVLLDSAAYDLVAVMEGDHADLYDQAFGDDTIYWQDNSPAIQLKTAPTPTLIVCSSKRASSICAGAEIYKNKITSLGGTAELLPVPLSHEDINSTLGEESDYTTSVATFIETVAR